MKTQNNAKRRETKLFSSCLFSCYFALFRGLFLVAFFLIASSAPAQPAGQTEVPVLQGTGSRFSRCHKENAVYDEEKFTKLVAGEECSNLPELLRVDFKKHTLIGFEARGDCFIDASVAVFRSDTAKTYTVRIVNFWGGCRAGGSFEGWLVIDKIPSGYKVEFTEERVDRITDGCCTTPLKPVEVLETRWYEMRGCIQTIYNKQFVIKSSDAFLKTIRNDASREFCTEKLEKIDFSRQTLLGIEINSGYCRTPVGLEYQTLKDETKKQYFVEISYDDPKGATCRALSQYDLWVLVPRLPEGYEVKFDVKAK